MNTPKMSRELMRDGFFRAAMGALLVSAVTLVVVVIGALRIDAVAAAPPPSVIPDSALRFPVVGAGTDIAAAVANDIFADDRQPPLRRYRMPGEPEVSARQPAPRPSVLGTAIGGDGSNFATCQLPGGQPTIVRRGSVIGGYTVVSIERGRVTFSSPDGDRFSVDASKPVP